MEQVDYQGILEQIAQEVKPYFGKGKQANYIPALAEIDPTKFGMAITTVSGEQFMVGNATEAFSIQSISKAFTLTMAMDKCGDKIWERIGREPSGSPFNSLVQLEYENGIPRNPFINAGAIVVTDSIYNSSVAGTLSDLLSFMRKLGQNSQISFDPIVAESEKQFGDRNRALANFLKSYGNLKNEAEKVLDVYFHQCSLVMSCADLSRALLFLANKGESGLLSEPVTTSQQAKRINSLMLTCGLYDAVGDFAYHVGLPGKSGVGGGIVAIIPNVLSVAVWSPELNKYGNSLIGTKALELFTTYSGLSVF